MSEDSLAELRNPNFDKQIYSFTLSEREPEIITHYDAYLLRAELFVTTPSKTISITQGWQKGGPQIPQEKQRRPSVTCMLSVIQFNTHNIRGLQNIIWQKRKIYEQR